MTGHANPPAPEDEEVAGLAGERTEMAWSRSGLALLSAAGAVAKVLVKERTSPAAAAIIYLLLAVGVFAWVAALAHAHVVARDMLEGRRVDNVRTFRLLTTGTTAFAFGALMLAILHRS